MTADPPRGIRRISLSRCYVLAENRLRDGVSYSNSCGQVCILIWSNKPRFRFLYFSNLLMLDNLKIGLSRNLFYFPSISFAHDLRSVSNVVGDCADVAVARNNRELWL